ncbi:MAG TPA: SBBP repeat-containing protein, partial [Bacteroidia bacterium]
MKKYLIVLFLIAICCKNMSAQSFEWAKRCGLYAFDLGYGVGTDNSGNVYIAGKYERNAYFGGKYVSCAGNHDIYIAKYGPSGSFKWVRTAGGSIGDYAHAIAVDGDGNCYITGEYETTTYFGSIALKSKGNNDVFVAKYDTNGKLIWVKNLGGGTANDRGLSITLSGGNVYVSGRFQGAAYLGGVEVVTAGGTDIFIAKYTTGGSFQWVKRAGGSGDDEGYAISNDPSGNLYMTGYFSGTAKFGGVSVTSKGGTDVFIAKYNSSGSVIWVKRTGGTGDDAGNAIKVDNSGRVFITGGFRHTSTFGSISISADAFGHPDIFIARYDSEGNAVWAKKAGGSNSDAGRAIAVDGSSNVFITGNYGKSATFSGTTIYGADITELYFASYDAAGNFRWV